MFSLDQGFGCIYLQVYGDFKYLKEAENSNKCLNLRYIHLEFCMEFWMILAISGTVGGSKHHYNIDFTYYSSFLPSINK